MSSTLYFITGNAGKFRELQAVIPSIKQLDLKLDEIQSLDTQTVIEHKLTQAALQHSGEFIVDDVSLSIPALGGLPGTMIKWFLEALGTSGLYGLVSRYEDASAVATVTLGYRNARGENQYFAEAYAGTIVAPRGENGFGFDPIFLATGQTKTNAELSAAEKNIFSARGKAARKLAAQLAAASQA